MGGVTEDEHIAITPTTGHLGPERVSGDANQAQLFGGCVAQPRLDQRLDALDGLVIRGRLALEQPEFPPVAGLPHTHVRAGALEAAQLVAALPLVEFGVGVDIDDQPVLLERQPVHVRTDRRPHRAAGAVAAQYVAGLDGLLAAAHPVKEAHPHPAGPVLGDAGDLDITPQHDVRIPLEVRPQHAFQLGLVEHVHLGVAVGAGLRTALQLRQHPHVGVEQSQTQRAPAVGGELVADAQAGQDAVDLVVGMHRARQRVDGFMAVQHQTRNAVLAKHGGRGDAGRAGTDDDHRHEVRQ